MPRYSELITSPAHDSQQRFQKRQQLLKAIEGRTGSPIIVYAANQVVANIPNSLDHSDITPFSEITRTVPGRSVDVLLHSPGGLAEAAERIVHLLRARFEKVRFVIPHSAFSAATMLATSADQLILDDTSALGPIDPQLIMRDPQTGQTSVVPTQAILEGFETAKAELKADPQALGVYLPLLNKLDLALFEVCKNVNKLARTLVTEWLKAYLLKDEPDPGARAEEVAEYLSTHKDRLSHGRPITLATIQNDLKIKSVLALKDDPPLRDLVGELWAEVEHFVENTGTAKFFENAYGVGFRRMFQVVQQPIAFPIPIPQPPRPQPPHQPGTPPQNPRR